MAPGDRAATVATGQSATVATGQSATVATGQTAAIATGQSATIATGQAAAVATGQSATITGRRATRVGRRIGRYRRRLAASAWLALHITRRRLRRAIALRRRNGPGRLVPIRWEEACRRDHDRRCYRNAATDPDLPITQTTQTALLLAHDPPPRKRPTLIDLTHALASSREFRPGFP